ncbi:hypothetical protein PIB30_059033 [Stylosanthes scabra]|uniref:Ubiquitin-like protease family profile domain-containing protein n=1 Tax=Stylosanthes scabra TaxID=79078 RepID=A0ABU6TJX7_9FABA|nr:hypothetical protein [Stylosanthes scabra]
MAPSSSNVETVVRGPHLDGAQAEDRPNRFGFSDEGALAKEIGSKIPQGMTMSFLPSPGMPIEGLELAVAAYLFNPSAKQLDILAPNPHCLANRESLRSLEPGKMLTRDVMILVAAMLKHNSTEQQHWFLPSTFTEIATRRSPLPQRSLKSIAEDFTGKVNHVSKIFCPVLLDNHWFLTVVDVKHWKIVYLDSCRKKEMLAKRRREIVKLAAFMEELFDDDSWYTEKGLERPIVTRFEWIELHPPQQGEDRNDSGMFVAQWMITYHPSGTHDVEMITHYSQMRLAVDLLLLNHNPARENVIVEALEHWRSYASAQQSKP